MYEGDPRNVLNEWLGERSCMALNNVLYSQPLVLTEMQVRALLDLRICRASFTTDRGQVVHCQEREGHLYMHRAGFSWEACPEAVTRYSTRYVCIRPGHHQGVHDFGGWGVDFQWDPAAAVTV